MGEGTWRRLGVLAISLLIPACEPQSPPSTGPIHLSPASLSFVGSIAGPAPATQLIRLTNSRVSAHPLKWTASSDKPWIQYDPPAGTTGTETDLFTIAVAGQQAEAWTTDTNLIGAPTGREDFSLIWTGSEMIVWGGYAGALLAVTDEGSRYDPALNAWTGTLSTVGAPTPRWGHTAVWTGREMIVWGGSDNGGVRLNDGYRYNPVTDTWSGPISTVSAPAARRAHTAVWTGTELIIWGGEVGGVPVNTGARYDPATDTWTPVTLTGAATIRWHHAAVWTGSEMIVWGGFDFVDGVNTGKRYSPSTDTWGAATSTTGTPPGRMTASAVWTGQEMIIFGGQSTQGSAGSDTGGRYDPVADSWQPTTLTNAPAARSGHEGIWTGLEMIVWGGAPALNSGKRYVPAIGLPVGIHTGTFTVSDPAASNSPQHVSVTYQITP